MIHTFSGRALAALLVWIGLDTTAACAQAGRPGEVAVAAADTGQAWVRWLGAAGWEIGAGGLVILVDPYLSRPGPPQMGVGQTGCRFCRPATDTAVGADSGERLDPRPPFGDDRPLPDTIAIDSLVARADYILVTHAHPDHLLDVPYLARRTGAVVVGNESSTNVLRAHGIADDRLVTVRGGEDLEFGTFSLRVVPSLHTMESKSYHDSRVIPRDVQVPLRRRDYYEGGSRAYLVRVAGRQILVFGSMNYIEREVDGLRPDVAIVGANASRRQLHDYAGRLMRALGGPPLVLPTHWDDQFQPLAEAIVRPEPRRVAEVEAFAREVRAASPGTRVVIPRQLERMPLPPPRR